MSAPDAALVTAVTGGLEPEHVRVRAGALELHCLAWGRRGDPTAVLVHGNGGHAHWWDALVPALVPGWRLIAPDLRGHGESDWPEPPAYRMEDFGADLAIIVDALTPGPVALAGHSMGGRITTWYAAQHPDRVRGLALIDTRLERVRPEVAREWRGRLAGKRHGRGYPSREAAMAGFRFVPEEAEVPAAVVADLAAHAVCERGPGEWTFRFDRAVLALEGDDAGDLPRMAARLRCPTWLGGGGSSGVLPADERAAIAAAIPHCTVELFPGGHHFLVAHAALVGPALRKFLDGLA